MTEQIKLTATMSAWADADYGIRNLVDALSSGNTDHVFNNCYFYGNAERKAFSDYAKVGTAEITLTLVAKDEITANAVKALHAKLEQARAEWLAKQAEIMEQISKFQALTFESPAREASNG
jgi:hypothetical protein